MDETRAARIRGWLAMIAVLGAGLLVIIGAFVLATRRDETVGLSKRIRVDDFSFQVDRVKELPATNGTLFHVELTVFNEAKRVDFDFDPALIVLVDTSGMQIAGVAPKGTSSALHLLAGQSGRAEVDFLAEAPVRKAYLQWSFGGNFGRAVDKVLFGDKRVQIK